MICLRFLQTAHLEKLRFHGNKREYTIWLLGRYNKNKDITDTKASLSAMPLPPVPPEI